jgi:hypothetical protein
MSGDPFLGYEIMRPGGVLFIALEGTDEVAIRLQAVIEDRRKIEGPAPFAWIETIPPLIGKNAADEICRIAEPIAKQMQEKFDVPLVLIIIDTMIAASGYARDGQENDAAAGQVVMNALQQVARRLRCFVLGIDHFGKAVETGTRGTSAKEGSADVVLALLGDKSGGGEVTNTRLTLRKRRGGPNGEEHPFTVRKVDSPCGNCSRRQFHTQQDKDGTPGMRLRIRYKVDSSSRFRWQRLRRLPLPLQTRPYIRPCSWTERCR